MCRIPLSLICGCASIFFIFAGTGNAEEPVPDTAAFERKQYFDFHAGSLFPFESLDARLRNNSSNSLNGSAEIIATGGILALGYGKYLTERIHVETTFAYGKFSNLEMRLRSGFVGNPDFGTTVQVTGRIDTYSLGASIFYDLNEISENITPFVGLGATASLATQSAVGRSGSNFLVTDRDFATTICLFAGLNMKLNETTDVYARYVGMISSATKFSDQNAQASFSTVTPGGYRSAFSVGMKYYYK